ncbi:ubiquinone biosynthesis protein Coq7 [Spinellus fusiger]|nr:ubiquinone biosynthesis protein Coq7 [Spinellus fusiger]
MRRLHACGLLVLSLSLLEIHHGSPRHHSTTSTHRPLTATEKSTLETMIRVDQAGEVGAYYIYKGQLAVLGKDKKVGPLLHEMWEQEEKHLERFDGLIAEHRVRPSLLRPLWEAAGFVVGVGTAWMGKEAAMACTEAVETVIGNHYNDQLRVLWEIKEPTPSVVALSKTVAQFRDDELEHHAIAVENDAHKAPFHTALKTGIMQGCKTAIWVAERV